MRHKKTAGGQPAAENRSICTGTDRVFHNDTRLLGLRQARSLFLQMIGESDPDPEPVPEFMEHSVWIAEEGMSFYEFCRRNRITTAEEIFR